MKRILNTALLLAGLFAFSQAYANTLPTDTTRVSTKVKRGLKKLGHKTAELAVKGEAAVVDRVYAGKLGPNDQTIYIDKNDNYYYVNDTGQKVYLKKTELRDKTSQ